MFARSRVKAAVTARSAGEMRPSKASGAHSCRRDDTPLRTWFGSAPQKLLHLSCAFPNAGRSIFRLECDEYAATLSLFSPGSVHPANVRRVAQSPTAIVQSCNRRIALPLSRTLPQSLELRDRL